MPMGKKELKHVDRRLTEEERARHARIREAAIRDIPPKEGVARNPSDTPADQARWIFAHPHDRSYGDGQRVVELLLARRDISELSSEELQLLAQGYNWWGKHAQSFEAAKLDLARNPREQFRLAGMYASNAFGHDLAGFIAACDGCIAEGLGPAAFWCLLKAHQYIAFATGERELQDFEWSPGHPILHPELLPLAAEALEKALAHQPDLREQEAARGWVGDWNMSFAAVLQEPSFRHLTQWQR
jgi:hypothetical protein